MEGDNDDDKDETLRVEVVDVNYYMAKPLPRRAIPSQPEGPSYDRAHLVPVVRIFGATPAGQKSCVHIHGILPYFYMRCENDRAFDTVDSLVELLPSIARDIEFAVRTLSQANATTPGTKSRRQSTPIAKLVVTKGIPFYGYHSLEVLFIKVFLYDPAMMSRIVQVVESGLVTQRIFQPYEAHIPFLLQVPILDRMNLMALQVFADFHIEGMNYLHIRNFTVRAFLHNSIPTRGLVSVAHATRPTTSSSLFVELAGHAFSLTLHLGKIWLTSGTTFDGREAPVLSSVLWNARTSVSSLELDVAASGILNPLGAAASDSQCYEEKLRRRAAGLNATPDVMPSIQRHAPTTPLSQKASPLSQSDFNDQMWASFDAILTRVRAKANSTDLPPLLASQHTPHELASGSYSYSQLDQEVPPPLVDLRQEVENEELVALLAKLQASAAMHETEKTRDIDVLGDFDDEGDDDDEAESLSIVASQREQEGNVDGDTQDEIQENPGLPLDAGVQVELLPPPSDENRDQVASTKFSFTQANFGSRDRPRLWQYAKDPPSLLDVLSGAWKDTPLVHYSRDLDVPEKPVMFAGRRFTFAKHGAAHLTEWNPTPMPSPSHRRGCRSFKVRRLRTPLQPPPTAAELLQDPRPLSQKRSSLTQSQPATPRLHTSVHTSSVTVLSVEIHVNTRGTLLPDPAVDAVWAIAYAVEANEGGECNTETGLLVVDDSNAAPSMSLLRLGNQNVRLTVVVDEAALFEAVDKLVHAWDPDFLLGFEVQQSSWGYLIDRATQLAPPMNLVQTLSRLPLVPMDSRNEPMVDGASAPKIGTAWGMKKAAGIWMHGRHILNLWRCARSELKLNQYTFEAVVAHVLKRRIPVHTHSLLTRWFQAGGSVRLRTLEYVVSRATLNLAVLDAMQLITRTSEMARLFGIDFYSVLSRGSQYRVEAVNIRVTKRLNYILLSPNRQQVATQPPMECIPLVMEPLSSFYGEPIVVLDFQSLYPSMMIAYNICYSTCFGRLRNGMDPDFESVFGVVPDHVVDEAGVLQAGSDTIITPNGVLFCPHAQRQGVLPLVLSEILSTRIMIKHAMKQTTNKRMSRVLDARQLALKMIANVTYGYTAASFSGRMPSAQLADAIVQCGRTTLEAAIKVVETHETWHAKVVYGDTDSLFVHLRGRTLHEALRIGSEIAAEVTARNPKPVCLKLEKVYVGSFLVSKKRYVGYKFESPTDKGQIDAKGIETIRRDSCGVVQHAMRHWLRLVFTTRDLSRCKKYLLQYWTQMHDGTIGLRDYIFAKEVRLGTYAGQGPPGALVAKKAMASDHRAEPRYAERVAYVVVRGAPGARLMDLVVSPDELVESNKYAINVDYYITKQILPSFERLAILMGVDVRSWYLSLPRKMEKAGVLRDLVSRTRIDAYYTSEHCRVCGVRGIHRGICSACRSKPQQSAMALQSRVVDLNAQLHELRSVCVGCMGSSFGSAWTDDIVCRHVGCAVWNEWLRAAALARQAVHEAHATELLDSCNDIELD
ncbi:Aste57867_24815 [Aphanomyces stellatus]|uniref:DNA polymerase n=1 Tax=Aphanomyces stellatus TaxID=120398 RepID=A0A485LRI0_9STRA|nr:hypothetical protein As57867_024737 [Aphanomyces stellatus]VFU01450.1 Aste57867_24815 [Aphanomyces stellatus]